jgi:predicted XRE-type DNA-binding protein
MVISLVLAPLLLITEKAHATEGLTAEVYSVQGQNNAPYIPQGASPVLTTNVSNVNFQWGSGSVLGGPSEDVIVRFTGSILSNVTQNISFLATADDGTKLYIDGQLIADDWFDKGGGGTTSDPVSFTAGVPKTIELMYYENGGGANVFLYWDQSGSMEIIPASAFTSQAAPIANTIGAPRNLTVVDGETSTVLTWEAPNTGNTQPERYAIGLNTQGQNGWGIATGNVGGPNSLNTTITIDHSLLESLMPSGTVWSFHIRSDNDTLAVYSENSNVVTLKIGLTQAEKDAQAAAALAAQQELDRQAAANTAVINYENQEIRTLSEVSIAEDLKLLADTATATVLNQNVKATLQSRIDAKTSTVSTAKTLLIQARLEAEAAARLAAEQEAARIAAEQEAARQAAILAEAARVEADRQAAIAEAARVEAERQAALAEAARVEAERQAAIAEANRIAAEQEAARQAAIRAEQERLAEIARQEAIKAEEEKAKAEEAARIAEEEARIAEENARIAEEERLKAEEDARIAEEERLRAEEEARIAEEERLKAEEEARIAEEEKAKAEEEARIAEENRLKAEEEAKAAEEARLKAEAEAKAAEEERLEAEAEAKAKAEEDARLEAERIAAEQEAKEKAEEDRIAEEKRLKAEADAKAKEEADRIAAEKANNETTKEEVKEAVAAVITGNTITQAQAAEVVNTLMADGNVSKAEVVNLVEVLTADGGKLNESEKSLVADALVASADGEALSSEQIKDSGIEYKDLPAETPVDVRTDEQGNAVVITAEVAAQVELLQDPGALLQEAFSDPGAALAALGSIGADMSTEEREEATDMVVATVVAAGAAINAAGVAAAGGSTGGSTGGGSSGGSSGSPASRGGRRW